MLKISSCFGIEEEVINDRLYHSSEQLNLAFSNNVIWEDSDRKRDLGIILYSLGKYISILEESSNLENIDLEMQLNNFELLLLSIMPLEWRYQVPYKKNKIESYFYSFTSEEAKNIKSFFEYIFTLGIFPDIHNELIEVINFWDNMSSYCVCNEPLLERKTLPNDLLE